MRKLLLLLALFAPAAHADVLVDVSGAVQRPGLYRLPDRATIQQALDAAGGAQATADLKKLALEQPVANGNALQASLTVPFAPLPKTTVAAKATAPKLAPRPSRLEDQWQQQLAQVRSGGDPRALGFALAERILPADRPQFSPLIEQALTDKEVPVRLFATAFLNRSRDRQWIGLLIRALQDSDFEVRSLAGEALPALSQKRR